MPEADILIRNGLVVTVDPAGTVLDPGTVAVKDGVIAAVAAEPDPAGWTARETIDAAGGIVMPGLVNVHTHAAMTGFRGLADDLPLMAWLENHIFPAEARLTADRVKAGSLLACAEMILSGTTCFCDMYLFEDAVAEAAAGAGVRAVVGEVLYDFPSPNYGPVEAGLAYTEALADKWEGHPLVSIAVEPHSPYLCDSALLQRASEIARRRGLVTVIHLSETPAEVERIRERYGCSPVEHLDRLGLLGPDLLACHCVALSEADMDLIARRDVRVAHNAESNMKLASGVAPIAALSSRGVCIGLGTDGCASNNNLDLFAEMDTAAKLQKVHTLDPTVLPAAEVLRMATAGGARALGLDDRIGSIAVGKRADLIVVDTRKPHLTPLYDPVSHLVYAARGGDVAATIIDGRIVMQDRRLRTIDLEAVTRAVLDWADDLQGLA